MRDEIIYALAIPSWDPAKVTPFQGFAPGLLYAAPLLVDLPRMPVDISELLMDAPDRLARRRAGHGGWHWSPVNVDSLVRHGHPLPARPFMVVFTAEPEPAKRVGAWRRGLRIRPLHVSTQKVGGAIFPHELTVERLQQHCLSALRQAKEASRRLNIEGASVQVQGWKPFEAFSTALPFHSHNVTLPNEMVLGSYGGLRPDDGAKLEASPEQDYVAGIKTSAQAVLDLHAKGADRPIYLLNPPRPDVILLAPGMHVEASDMIARAKLPDASIRAFRALERQRGYTIPIPMDKNEIDQIGPIVSMRGAELGITTYAVGVRAASTVAATLRLPPRISRTSGVVGQLGRFLRDHENPPPTKTARVFRAVQDALADSLPEEHRDILRQSRSGVKIIGEAPLEWLPLDGVPLGIARDVSRIGTTPGNLFIEQLRHVPPTYVSAKAFKDYLAVSMFEEGDGIAHHVRKALTVLPGASAAKLTGTSVTAKTRDEFVAAVNAYRGPILIVDSHGDHPERSNVGGLEIGGELVDVWSLEGKLRPPPIVVLSACDTHPHDRSHATVANGFLKCGATAVLATVLPIRARDAAVFLVRLMLRAIEFGGAMNSKGRATSWTNIVGGALRMQLAGDVVHGLVQRKMIPAERAREIQLQANYDINPPNEHIDWMTRLRDRCMEAGSFKAEDWQQAYDDILAASDVIRYVNIGNPEALVIADERVLQRTYDESVASESGEALSVDMSAFGTTYT